MAIFKPQPTNDILIITQEEQSMLRPKIFWVLGLALALSTSAARAGTQQFSTQSGATDTAGDPVSAVVVFTVKDGEIDISLTNLQGGIKDAGQLLSDLFFGVTGAGSLTGSTASNNAAPLITVNADKTVTSNGTGSPGWTWDPTTGHLDGLGSGKNQIIGPASADGKYDNANSSIAGNGPHNPLVNQTATFVITASGVTAAGTTITGVQFSFGTAAGDNLPGSPSPEPSTLAIAGLGALGFLGYGLRRRLKK
jgi:hypothetical protein